MLERLIDFIVELRDNAKPFAVIDAWEGGVVLRLGKFHRELAPGYHWKWPFVEQVSEVTTVETTLRLPPQTLTTKDGRGVVASAIVKYEVTKLEPYVTKIFDQNDVLADVTMGAVRRAVTSTDYEKLMADPPEREILEIVRSAVNKYGFRVHGVTFVDLAEVWSVRLIQAAAKDIAN